MVIFTPDEVGGEAEAEVMDEEAADALLEMEDVWL